MKKSKILPMNPTPQPEPEFDTRRLCVKIVYNIGFKVFAEAAEAMKKDPEKEYKRLQDLTIHPPLTDYQLQPAFFDLISKTDAELQEITVYEGPRKDN